MKIRTPKFRPDRRPLCLSLVALPTPVDGRGVRVRPGVHRRLRAHGFQGQHHAADRVLLAREP
jgi:hypothetical protein